MTFHCAFPWTRTALITPALLLALAGCSAVSKLTDSVKAAGADLLGVGKPHAHPAPWKRAVQ